MDNLEEEMKKMEEIGADDANYDNYDRNEQNFEKILPSRKKILELICLGNSFQIYFLGSNGKFAFIFR